MILTDQLSRNCFRGKAEAFAYDERAHGLALQLLDDESALQFPTSVAMFMCTPLTHKEDITVHERVQLFAEKHYAASKSPVMSYLLTDQIPKQTKVLLRFGRYPGRNTQYGRETTAEEEAWLASDECPGWAKPQKALLE